MRGRGRPRIFDHDKARRMRAEGMTITQISIELGVSWMAVKYAVDEKHREEQKAKR